MLNQKELIDLQHNIFTSFLLNDRDYIYYKSCEEYDRLTIQIK